MGNYILYLLHGSSFLRNCHSNLIIRQGKEQGFKPKLYIENSPAGKEYENELNRAFIELEKKYPGISLAKSAQGWEIVIPDNYREGHEAHFARVTEKYLSFLKSGTMPAWEVPNMLAKYYTTTKALELSVVE